MNMRNEDRDYEAVQKALDLLGKLEGDYIHFDLNEYLTSPYGLILEKNHPAYARNAQMAKNINLELHEGLTLSDYKDIAEERLRNDLNRLKRDLSEDTWDNLSIEAKAVLLDFKYHTDVTYSEFAQKAIQYEADPTRSNLLELVSESYRYFRGNRTDGLDNRTVSVLYEHGYIDSIQEGISLGLVKANRYANAPME